MGFFLLLIAIVGLVGAIHHHQVMLFFVSLPLVGIDPPMIGGSFARRCDLNIERNVVLYIVVPSFPCF